MTIAPSFSSYLRDVAKLVLGSASYLRNGRTPNYAYQSMIRLFCMSAGRSNDMLSKALGIVRPKYRLNCFRGVLGDSSSIDVEGIANIIRQKGYYVSPLTLPTHLCDSLRNYALTSECLVRPMDHDKPGSVSEKVPRYEREKPRAVRYDFDSQSVINNPDVQGLMADLSILAVAQAYLDCRPVLDVMSMWWHTSHSNQPDKAAAQYWHFDMDRIKWLKFFIYLTDVESENGPHSFVEGSHRTGGIPGSLLTKGYSRLTDEEVEAYYERERFIEFTAPRGTLIAEDTRGLHKGKHVKCGDRLVLQLQYSNSLFGAHYPKYSFSAINHSDLRAALGPYLRVFDNYHSTNT